MENKVKLYEICDDLSDGLHAAPLFNPDGEYLFVNAINLENGYIVDTGDGKRADYSEYVKYKIDLNKRTILYSIDGTIGKIAKYRGEKVILGKGACYIKLKESVNADYIYYLLQSALFQGYLKSMTTGSTIHHISLETMRNFLFELPPRDVQDCIAGVLSTLDAKIDNNIHLCAELEAMAKTLYDYWFVQFDFPDENGKPYRTSGGAMEWCQEMGREVPKGWKVRRLPEVSSVQYGFPLSTEQFSSTGNRVVRIRDIIDNSYSALTNEAVGNEYFTQEGDLLVGMDGNFQMNYWTRSGDIVNQRITRIRKTVIPIMLIKMQIQPYITAKIDTVARSTVGHLGDADFSERYVLVPESLDIEIFDAYLSKIISLRKESQELSDLRDWILPMLMNGQARI